MTEEIPKPRYEPPFIIDLRSMAKARGSYCGAGPLDVGDYCTAGGSNPLACTDSGVAAYYSCTAGEAATVTTCSAGGHKV